MLCEAKVEGEDGLSAHRHHKEYLHKNPCLIALGSGNQVGRLETYKLPVIVAVPHELGLLQTQR